jgi:hypothetical protein
LLLQIIGWLKNFKKRHGLVCRQQTSSRIIPDDAAESCLGFINEIQETVEKFKIDKDKIRNLDQVPRYFENEGKTTITKRGSKNVKLKASNSHKKFTATFHVSASGDFLRPHSLFGQLKNVPKVHPGCDADVNTSSMWSMKTLRDFIDKNYGSTDKNVHYLIVLDSYGVHTKFVKEESCNYPNLHFVLIPPNLTSLLQPLDVAINKSFQSFFGDCYNRYMARAISDTNFHTKNGNIKTPTYECVTGWIVDWIKVFDSEIIVKAFQLCGIVPKENFDIQKLHELLRKLLAKELTPEECENQYSDIIQEQDLPYVIQEVENPKKTITLIDFDGYVFTNLNN